MSTSPQFALLKHLRGDCERAMAAFYDRLPSVPRHEWPDMLLGMGFNFEFYDGMFAVMIGNIQLAMDASDYSRRSRAVQNCLRPFCSEYGIEIGQPIAQTHRDLYADFYARVVGQPMPERYPEGSANPWLAVARRWCGRMAESLAASGKTPAERARFNIGYFWTVEHLSVAEFALMREAWTRLGVEAPYLDVHCYVEDDHDACSTRALLEFTDVGDPSVLAAIEAHEGEIAGYYRELAGLVG
jgi:hypothetical protein